MSDRHVAYVLRAGTVRIPLRLVSTARGEVTLELNGDATKEAPVDWEIKLVLWLIAGAMLACILAIVFAVLVMNQ